jgi:hypothetical protein
MINAFSFDHKLKGPDTRKTKVRVAYYTKEEKDEFDVVLDFIRENGRETNINMSERLELKSAALNHYFVHVAA